MINACPEETKTPPRNTFQVALTTDGRSSFVPFNYAKIEWTSAPENFNGDCASLNNGNANPNHALAGLLFHNQTEGGGGDTVATYMKLPNACTPEVINITQNSNIGVPGKYIYRVDLDPSRDGYCYGDSTIKGTRHQLNIFPNTITQLRSKPLKMSGPCITPSVKNVTCIFYDDENETYKTEGILLKNQVPAFVYCPIYFHFRSLGRKRVELKIELLNGAIATHSGFVYVITDDYDNESPGPITTQPADSTYVHVAISPTPDNKAPFKIKAKWDPGMFKGDDDILKDISGLEIDSGTGTASDTLLPSYKDRPVDIHLQTFDGIKWTDLGVIVSDIKNNGHFDGEIDADVHESILGDIVSASTKPAILSVISISISKKTKERIAKLGKIAKYLINKLKWTCIAWGVAETGLGVVGCHAYNLASTTSDHYGTEPCPRTQMQAQQDQRFSPKFKKPWKDNNVTHSYRQRNPSPSGSGSVCNYGKCGNLMLGYPNCGTMEKYNPNGNYWNHILHDVVPDILCCKIVDLFGSCKAARDVRPCRNSTDYVPPRPARAAGDPHITTFDGLFYTFNGAGEFWMVKYENGEWEEKAEFKMQARMEQYRNVEGRLKDASIFTAFVMEEKVGNGTVTLQVSHGGVSNGINILLDQEPLILEEEYLRQTDFNLRQNGLSFTVSSGGSSISVTCTTGFSFEFTTIGENEMGLNLVGMASNLLKGKVIGLMGKFDGDPDNDLMIPDGSILQPNSSLEDIHYKFGLKWMTKKEDSIFKNQIGKKWEDYSKPQFVPTFPQNLNEVDKTISEKCGGHRECIFDYVTTGSIAVANASKITEEEVQKIIEIADAPVKMCESILDHLEANSPKNGYIQITHLLEGGTMSFECLPGFQMERKWGALRCTCEAAKLSKGESVENDLTWNCVNEGSPEVQCLPSSNGEPLSWTFLFVVFGIILFSLGLASMIKKKLECVTASFRNLQP